MNKKLVVLNHHEKNETVYICFAEFEDNRIISQEEAIFEEEEFYTIIKKWLVKYKNNKSKHRVLLNNCVDDDRAILHKREIEPAEDFTEKVMEKINKKGGR